MQKFVLLKTITIVALCFMLLYTVWFSEALYGASFDCKLAKTNIEKAICDDRELSRLDRKLARVYKYHSRYMKITDGQSFKREQIAWLKQRDKQCGIVTENKRGCLIDLYIERIAEIMKDHGFVSTGMSKNEPELKQFLVKQGKFDLYEDPEYFKISDTDFIVPIGWSQGARMQLGFYMIKLDDGTIRKLANGHPSIEGMYKDDGVTVLVLTVHHLLRGFAGEKVLIITVSQEGIEEHIIANVGYYSNDGSGDPCKHPINSERSKSYTVETIELINIKDLNEDGKRDVIVKIKNTNCGDNSVLYETKTLILQ